jgi:hypothetical protein
MPLQRAFFLLERGALEASERYRLITIAEERKPYIAVGGCFAAARRTYSMLMTSQTVVIAA